MTLHNNHVDSCEWLGRTRLLQEQALLLFKTVNYFFTRVFPYRYFCYSTT